MEESSESPAQPIEQDATRSRKRQAHLDLEGGASVRGYLAPKECRCSVCGRTGDTNTERGRDVQN